MSSAENTVWWIVVVVLLVLILIVLIVIAWMIGSALSYAKKGIEQALCKFYVFEDRVVQGIEKWGEKARPVIEKGLQRLEGLEGKLLSNV